jgi:hypothetical protein
MLVIVSWHENEYRSQSQRQFGTKLSETASEYSSKRSTKVALAMFVLHIFHVICVVLGVGHRHAA